MMFNNTELDINRDYNIEFLKWSYLGTISLTTFLGTFLLPWLFRKYDHYLHYMNGFSGAIMFSTALIHLIPELAEYHLSDYPFPFLFVVLSFYIIMFIEKILFHVHHHEVNINTRNELVGNLANIIAVGLHATVAGITLGMSQDYETLTHMFVSIISHKVFASYAIGNKMFKSQTKLAIVLPLLLFNLMTPGGIIIGFYINNFNPWLNMTLKSIAAGAFLYIGCADTLIDEIELHHDHNTSSHISNFTSAHSNTSPITIHVGSNNTTHKNNKLKLYLAQLLGVTIIASIKIIYLYTGYVH